MKHIIHRKNDPQIPMNYDAMAEFNIIGSETILTTYGPRGGTRGYICLDKYELRSLIQDMLFDTALYSPEKRRELATKMIQVYPGES